MLQVREGNQEAFKRLYERFKAPVLSYVMNWVMDRNHAEEITQEVFLRAYRARETYELRAKFSTWLWTLARNAAIDHVRKKQEILLTESEETESSPTIESFASEQSDAEAQLVEQTAQAQLEKCIERLSPPQKDALLLRTVSELSYEEISVTMKSTLSAVKSLINRAKAALVACIQAHQRTG